MKVLHVFNEIKYSGAEIMYANAIPIFRKEGVDMIALSTGKDVGDFAFQFEQNQVKVYHKPLLNGTLNPIILFKYFRDILRLVKVEKIEVIHIHRSTFYSLFALVGFIAKTKNIRTVHNVFKNRNFTWPKAVIERFVARNYLGVKFQSIGESVYQNELLYYKNPTVKINNWFDSNKFSPAINKQEKSDIRVKLNIPDEAFVIISTGGCSHVKNHHAAIEALSIVNKIRPCIYLHLGSGKTEEEEIALSKTLGITDMILFLKNKVNVRDYLISSDVYIMPSLYEGLGNAALEAMACGLPSILYDGPGLNELISNDDNGLLIPQDMNILAEKILLLSANLEMANEMGKNAKKFVNSKFSIDLGVKGIIKLYNL